MTFIGKDYQHRVQPNHSSALLHNDTTALYLRDDPTPDPVDVECVDILKQPDPCDFIRTNPNCDIDSGNVPWLEFRYCYLPRHMGQKSAGAITIIIVLVVLVVTLNSLGHTADVFFVPGLQQVATELKLSPAVAGISLVSFGNASPDMASSISSVASGDLPLVLGALAGACVCLALLVLGSALYAAPEGKTRLPKFQFWRSVAGYAVAVGVFIIISARGSIRLWASLTLIGIYAIYLICNVVYLQRQEVKLRAMRQGDRKLTFLKQFKSFRNFDREQTKSLLADCPGSYGDDGDDDGNVQGLNSSGAGYTAPVLFIGGNGNTNGDDEDGLLITSSSSSSTTSTYKKDSLYHNKDEQTKEEAAFVDLDVINAVDMADQKARHDKHSKLHQLHASHTSTDTTVLDVNGGSGVTFVDDNGNDDDDDDDVEVDEASYMDGITYPNPEWAQETFIIKLTVLKLLWILAFPFGLLKWLSIPATGCRPDFLVGPKRLFFFISPIFLSLLFLYDQTDAFTDIHLNAVAIALPATGVGLSLLSALFYFFIVIPRTESYYNTRDELRQRESEAKKNDSKLTTHDLAALAHNHLEYDLDLDDADAKPTVMSIYQLLVSALAFVGSIQWLGFFADEIVNVLGSLGLMFGVSSTILGLSVLSLGNSLPDLIAGTAIAAKGKIGMSYAAIFGAPVLSSTLGFGLATLLKFIQHGQMHLTLKYDVTVQLWLCFGATIGATLLHCIVFPMTGFAPPKLYGIILIVGYVAFLAAAVLIEVLG